MIVVFAYVVAVLGAFGAGWFVRDAHPFWVVFVADVAGTIVIFVFSRIYDNSSFYDPYWSVVPPLIGLYFLWLVRPSPRGIVAVVLVTIWGARLTYNWWRRWDGLEHEDWRYLDLRAIHGRRYWFVSFFGIHFFPTVLVFLGCLPLFAIVGSGRALNLFDALAVAVIAAAITIEAVADQQLRAHATSDRRDTILDRGLWAWSRHPNYLGELLLWWGLMLFAWSSGARWWWIYLGAAAMTGLFVFISIPMVERRSVDRRGEAFEAYRRRTSVLLPWPPRPS